ncbi:MAG: TIM-barrel domain-containing protein [Anaerolineae bacterium]
MNEYTPSALFGRIRFRGQPVAHHDAVVVDGKARFTFLTSRLVRLEWSATGDFEDRGTYAFPTRYTPTPPELTVQEEGDDLVVETDALRLRYQHDSGPFDEDNLSITFQRGNETVTWRPGMPDPQNLRGTRRTLDGCAGDAALEPGLLSRAGWSLFDDSASVVYRIEDGWVAPRPEHRLLDWYFFCYGHDYTLALAEYTRFGGKIPLIPRFVLGAWWSRYWAYSAQDLEELVSGFERYDLPLDVLVIDMDWHTPHAWTGYTWNRELFPDPPAFLGWVHDKGLHTTLNLHPAQGIQSFEEIYPRFARAMGLDPDGTEAIPFRITDKRFVKNYFELLHHLMEDEGVDFWWIDWQQGESSEMAGLDPLPWLNHLHFSDAPRRGKRPMLYSRWGGLGNHRYHIGFSGDTIVGWDALQFQPYLTATSSNVAYGWWSHDIGGHMGGATEPELFARWVQFGALSPCLRLHSTKDPRAERRPWKYPDEVYLAVRAAYHMRYQLLPYLYTMARVAADTGLALCRPMYYAYPEAEDAYVARYQYLLGEHVIAAPIVHPADEETGLASADVWVPEGTWVDYQTKETFVGPRWVRLVGGLDRVPILIAAGAILPLASSYRDPSGAGKLMASGTTSAIPYDELVLQIFPGPQGAFRLYEDDGTSMDYQLGQYEWTPIETSMEDQDTWSVEIGPVEGRCDALPEARSYVLHLEGCRQPTAITVDGEGTRDWTYNPETLTATVRVPLRDKHERVVVTAWNAHGISALGQAHDEDVVWGDVCELLDCTRVEAGDVDAVLRSAVPGRADAAARLGGPLIQILEYVTPEEAAQQLGRVIVGAPSRGGDSFDVEVLFTRSGPGELERHTIRREGCHETQIVTTPFSYGGQVQAQRWEAAVEVRWRGETLSAAHQSKPIFPTIHTWRALVYEKAHPVAVEQVVTQDGTTAADLDWELYQQGTGELTNINEPYGVIFSRAYRERLHAGEKLAAYLWTTVVSPDDREAVLAFGAGGSARVYLNGQEVEAGPAEALEGMHRMLRDLQKTVPIRLRAGENTLLVETQPPEKGRPFWYFGGMFLAPEGELALMTDLDFR